SQVEEGKRRRRHRFSRRSRAGPIARRVPARRSRGRLWVQQRTATAMSHPERTWHSIDRLPTTQCSSERLLVAAGPLLGSETMKLHLICAALPEMAHDEFAALKESIRHHG